MYSGLPQASVSIISWFITSNCSIIGVKLAGCQVLINEALHKDIIFFIRRQRFQSHSSGLSSKIFYLLIIYTNCNILHYYIILGNKPHKYSLSGPFNFSKRLDWMVQTTRFSWFSAKPPGGCVMKTNWLFTHCAPEWFPPNKRPGLIVQSIHVGIHVAFKAFPSQRSWAWRLTAHGCYCGRL